MLVSKQYTFLIFKYHFFFFCSQSLIKILFSAFATDYVAFSLTMIFLKDGYVWLGCEYFQQRHLYFQFPFYSHIPNINFPVSYIFLSFFSYSVCPFLVWTLTFYYLILLDSNLSKFKTKNND